MLEKESKTKRHDFNWRLSRSLIPVIRFDNNILPTRLPHLRCPSTLASLVASTVSTISYPKPANLLLPVPARVGYNADEPDRADNPVNLKLTFKAQPKKHIVSL